MGPVLKMAAIKPEVALLDNDDLESIEDDVDWQFVTLGEQQNFGIKTACYYLNFFVRIVVSV